MLKSSTAIYFVNFLLEGQDIRICVICFIISNEYIWTFHNLQQHPLFLFFYTVNSVGVILQKDWVCGLGIYLWDIAQLLSARVRNNAYIITANTPDFSAREKSGVFARVKGVLGIIYHHTNQDQSQKRKLLQGDNHFCDTNQQRQRPVHDNQVHSVHILHKSTVHGQSNNGNSGSARN